MQRESSGLRVFPSARGDPLIRPNATYSDAQKLLQLPLMWFVLVQYIESESILNVVTSTPAILRNVDH